MRRYNLTIDYLQNFLRKSGEVIVCQGMLHDEVCTLYGLLLLGQRAYPVKCILVCSKRLEQSKFAYSSDCALYSFGNVGRSF